MKKKLISLNKVSIYRNQFLVLQEIDFNLNSGDFYYLVGKKGSGKSSFLKLLYGDLPLLEGEGQIINYNLKKLKNSNIPLLKKKLGIISQNSQFLLDRNVEENLKFVLKTFSWKESKKINKRIDEILESVDIINKKYSNIYELSEGEQQCLVIARAILNFPKIIIADNPTINLDPENSLKIIQLISNINRNTNCGVLIATHNYSLIRKFPSHILKFKDKKISIL